MRTAGTPRQQRDNGHRNPAWTRDELILALDLYFQGARRVLDDTDSRVIELSKVLNSLPIHSKRAMAFRNPNGHRRTRCVTGRFWAKTPSGTRTEPSTSAPRDPTSR